MNWWPFKRRKPGITGNQEKSTDPLCPQCGSRNTELKLSFNGEQPDYVKIWRGQRFINYRCLNCGCDFSLPAPSDQGELESQIDARLIDDENALKEAEEALKRQSDEDGDHRFG